MLFDILDDDNGGNINTDRWAWEQLALAVAGVGFGHISQINSVLLISSSASELCMLQSAYARPCGDDSSMRR